MKSKLWILLGSLMASTAAIAQTGPACPKYTTENFTLTELTKIIRTESCQVKTIDDVLGLLPERMRSKLTMFYRSQSLQGPHRIDYVNPRTILSSVESGQPPPFSNLAKVPTPAMMLSFNGNPSQAGYNRLELVNLAPTPGNPNVFTYHEIAFPPESTVATLSWEQAQAQIKISPPNPARCVQCHGIPARPIFQQYPTWDGAFGAKHITDLSVEEKDGLAKFVQTHADNPRSRYRHLNPKRFSPGVGTTPQYPKSFGLSDHIDFGGAAQTIAMNSDLWNYNGVRVADLIRKAPFYSQFKFAIAGGLIECGDQADFFPTNVLRRLEQGVDPEGRLSSRHGRDATDRKFIEIVQRKNRGAFGGHSSFLTIEDMKSEMNGSDACEPDGLECLANHKAFWKSDPVLSGLAVDTMANQGTDRMTPEEATMLRLVFEGQGVNISNWWMDLRQGTYRTNPGFGKNWIVHLRVLDSELDSVLGTQKDVLNQNNLDKGKKQLCEKLAKLSQTSLAGYQVPQKTLSPEAKSASGSFPGVFTNTCILCHVANEVGPHIPFDDPAQFSEWYHSGNNARKIQFKVFEAQEGRSMPPIRLLNAEEKNQISDYLKTLR